MLRTRTIALAGLVALAIAQPAAALSIWDESVDGDLSNDPSAPTHVAFGPGTNSIVGSSQLGDVDLFTFTVPNGVSFARLELTEFSSSDDLAFLAIEAGSVVSDMSSPANLLGYVHVAAAFLGTDILDDLALGQGALGFSAPLGPGTYTLWMQQTGPELVGYGFDLIAESSTVPEPPMSALFVLGLGALALVRRRPA